MKMQKRFLFDKAKHKIIHYPFSIIPLFFAVPAVGAKLALIHADGFYDTIDGLEAQRGEFELFANGLAHFLAALGIAVGIFVQVLKSFLTLQLKDDPTGDQIHIAGGTGEIQVFAAIHDGRTGRTHMYGLCTVFIKEFYGFLQLGATNDGVIHKQ